MHPSRPSLGPKLLATGLTVRGSNPGGGEIFPTHPDRPWGLLYSGYWVFPRGKVAGAWHWPPTTSSAEVEERVELYPYSLSGPSCPVLGWPLPLPCRRAGWMELWLYTFLDLALTAAEWSASCLSCFTHSSPWVGWCLGLGTGLDILEEEKSLVFAKIQSTACSLVTTLSVLLQLVSCQMVHLVVLYWDWCWGCISWFICEHYATYVL